MPVRWLAQRATKSDHTTVNFCPINDQIYSRYLNSPTVSKLTLNREFWAFLAFRCWYIWWATLGLYSARIGALRANSRQTTERCLPILRAIWAGFSCRKAHIWYLWSSVKCDMMQQFGDCCKHSTLRWIKGEKTPLWCSCKSTIIDSKSICCISF